MIKNLCRGLGLVLENAFERVKWKDICHREKLVTSWKKERR